LKRICLTHAHFSHLAGLIALKALSDAEICAHPWEADIIAGQREAQRVPLLPRRPFRVYYPFQLGASVGKGASGAGEGRFGGCSVDSCLRDGQVLGPLRVIHAPGHTPGHLAFWVESQGVLLAGDAIVTWPYVAGGWDSFTLNKRMQRESLRKLAEYAPEKVAVGHGGAIVNKSADVVKRLADKAESRAARSRATTAVGRKGAWCTALGRRFRGKPSSPLLRDVRKRLHSSRAS